MKNRHARSNTVTTHRKERRSDRRLKHTKDARDEPDIFCELEKLCASPGYVHAIAYFCWRDNVIKFGESLIADDLQEQHSERRLLRTEISTLIGLLVKQSIDFAIPEPNILQQYIARTEELMHELHLAMTKPWFAGVDPVTAIAREFDPFNHAEGLREPIFYGGESAYGFQYRQLANLKYADDDKWLETHKGFHISDATRIADAIGRLQNTQQLALLKSFPSIPPDQWTMLPGFEFSVESIAREVGLNSSLVERVLTAFCCPSNERNISFLTLSDFNSANAAPILRIDDEKFMLLQQYSLLEAIYETPFFWMTADKAYAPTALANRGRFTENFVGDRLVHVFGPDNVLRNVGIYRGKDRFAEIDVLVTFGDRAIVVQAKSKRLTIEARKGNDLQLKDDFKKAVQNSYDQAYACSTALLGDGYKFIDENQNDIALGRRVKSVFPVSVVADHYPALAFQARQFLVSNITPQILYPLVTDVFAVDVIAEMLSTPLHFLHYLTLRTRFGDKISSANEFPLLSFHLKGNLWVDDSVHLVMIGEDVSADLDIAMLARREGIPGKQTPDGILTFLKDMAVGRLIAEIEARADPETTSLGLFLLQLNGTTAKGLSEGIERIVRDARNDGRHHDISVGHESGLTVHCNHLPNEEARTRLISHCHVKKYDLKAASWFGLLLNPIDGSIKAALSIEEPWTQDDEMDELIKKWPRRPPTPLANVNARPKKIGRNDPCPCGSDKNYKKCCLNIQTSTS